MDKLVIEGGARMLESATVSFVVEMHDEYDRRRQLMTRRFNEIGLHCFEPRGAFYCFPSVAGVLGRELRGRSACRDAASYSRRSRGCK